LSRRFTLKGALIRIGSAEGAFALGVVWRSAQGRGSLSVVTVVGPVEWSPKKQSQLHIHDKFRVYI